MTTAIINYTLNASPAEVYPYFLDFEKFGKLHPYMVEIKKLEANHYSISEKLFLYGFIPMRPFYTATVHELEKDKKILYTSHVKRGVDLKLFFHFSDPGNGTVLIRETIEVEANKLIAVVFVGLIKKAHKKLIESLENTTKNKNGN